MSLLRRLRERPAGPLAWMGRDLGVAFVGHVGSHGLGVLTFVVMTQSLAPADYGVFLLGMAVLEIGLYASDLGLNVGTSRFVSKKIRGDDPTGVRQVLKAVFLAKLATATFVFAAGFAGAPFIAGTLLARPELTPYLRIACGGIFGAQLNGFYQAYFGSRLQFLRNAVFGMVAPLAILAAIVALRLRGELAVQACLWIYAGAPLAVCGVLTAVIGPRFLPARTRVVEPLRSVWRFSRWVYLTNLLATVRFRLSSLLLARLATMEDVGLYGYGDKLASVLTLLTGSFTTVFVPRASHLMTPEEIRGLLRSSYRWMLPLIGAMLVVPFFGRPLIAVLAPDYVLAAPIFSVLFVSILFSLAAVPSSTVLYSLNRPHVETGVEAIALAFTAVVGTLLIVRHGAIGAAAGMLFQRAISSAIIVGWVWANVYRPAADLGADASGGAAE